MKTRKEKEKKNLGLIYIGKSVLFAKTRKT